MLPSRQRAASAAWAGAVVIALAAAAAIGKEPAGDSPRLVESLNAGWRFVKGDREGAALPAFDDREWEHVDLPHTWNAQDGQDGGNDYYRGPGWYRRTLHVPRALRGRRVFLRFGAANTVADVYVNGAHVGQHRGGFSAFCFDVTSRIQFGGDNSLAVRADNSHFDDVPPWSADFTFFGGIYRDVQLIVTGPVCISPLDYASPGVYLRPEQVSARRADAEVAARISNALDRPQEVIVAALVRDHLGQVVAESQKAAALEGRAETSVAQRVSIAAPHLWNGRRDPYLYSVNVELRAGDKVLDAVRQPLGLRWFHVDADKGLSLNGRHLDLHGVSRHQDRPDRGWAVGRTEHEQDIALINQLGCTGVRLAHYQQDDYVYSLCDRTGLIVWAEIPLVNRIVDSPTFSANCRQQLIELIRQNYNHPSVFFWGIHNEITAPWEPGPDPTALVKELAALAKAEDPSRLTVCAATDPVDHPANWQTDLVAFNRYFGWYNGMPDEFGAWADRVHREHPGRPLGVSEYGAGASIRDHEYPPEKPRHDGDFHPEEWQAYLHERHWLAIRRRPYLWCSFVWNMFDFASDGRSEGDAPGRNDKGLVTYDRHTRKDAFYWYEANWSDEPLVYITGRRYVTHARRQANVRVYSNCPTVELYVNDRFWGAGAVSQRHVINWSDVPLQPGINRLRVRAQGPAGAVEDGCEWNVQAAESD